MEETTPLAVHIVIAVVENHLEAVSIVVVAGQENEVEQMQHEVGALSTKKDEYLQKGEVVGPPEEVVDKLE